MTVRPRTRPEAATSIATTILWVVIGVLITWLTLAAVAGLLTPVWAAAGP